ncbi:hypothetical protein AG74_78 [Vibrio phage AG74]|uniref:Uncharacterized protein n=2 Tax=Thalassavirus TaxID=2948922 RepID=A0A6M9Z1J8_9CAUD|nr:hypothetical protein KNU59_gp076 [Vibrio phage Pontus]YP_010108123.1 hypothetical protein KNV06_gp078 [Vibrio phage AG74]QDF14725.1 hypothetical protein PONTUS_76 [Vibrio phage Pontus]QKN84937.1 hypothetical protein AG74_78 [Vibrio phage AG74]
MNIIPELAEIPYKKDSVYVVFSATTHQQVGVLKNFIEENGVFHNYTRATMSLSRWKFYKEDVTNEDD